MTILTAMLLWLTTIFSAWALYSRAWGEILLLLGLIIMSAVSAYSIAMAATKGNQ